MTQSPDGRFYLFLALTLLRAAYAALVLGLGAIDVRLAKSIAPKAGSIQNDWATVDLTELECFAPVGAEVAQWPSSCFVIPAGSSAPSAQSPILRILPYAGLDDRATGYLTPRKVN